MSFITDNLFTILIASVILLLYLYLKKKFQYFSTRGLPYEEPSLRNFLKSFSLTSFADVPNSVYAKFRESGHPIIGFFRLSGPAILVIDPDVVEKVLIKDFSHFHDHGFNIDTKNEPLGGHLFNMQGDQWRTLRNKLLPTFTSGKLKGMVPAMDECALTLINEIKQDKSLTKDVNLKELFKSYTISVIARCVFALDPEGIKDPNCEFRQLLKKLSSPSFIQIIRTTLAFTLPGLSKYFKIKLFPKELDNFFIKLTKDTLNLRKISGIKRNDFVQLLLELKEKGTVQVDVKDLEEEEKKKVLQAAQSEDNTKLEITDELLAAQSFVFIIAGFDNTSFLTSITMYYLSKHKDVQDKVRQEVKDALSKHGGLNYPALKDMKILEGSINEALRIQPGANILFRQCNKSFQLDNGMTIEKGMAVLIPSYGLHRDPKYWQDPEKFDPERFINDDITPGTFTPFGDGPRICIAQRLALLMTKKILAELLVNFDLEPSSKTKEPLKVKLTISADVVGGLWGSFNPLKE